MLPHEEYLQIPVSPGNCLAWSQDGSLAIAAQGEVHILVPIRRPSQEDASSPWTRVSFNAARFTSSELPPPEQAPSTKMSIGEEQGEISVISIAWSPPGLAIHKRSALAVLTSNNILSLWAPGSDPTRSESWERVLIINEHHRPNSSATLRPESRIRAFAWADRLDGLDFDAPFSSSKRGLHILALAEDDCGVDLVLVYGPGCRMAVNWQIQRVAGSSVSEMDGWRDFRQNYEHGTSSRRQYPPSRHSLFDASMGASKRIDGIVWSPWIHQDGKLQSVLSVHARLSTCHMCLSVKEERNPYDSIQSDSFQLEYLKDLILGTSSDVSLSDHHTAWHYFSTEDGHGLGIACGRQFDLYRLNNGSLTFAFDRICTVELPEIEYDIDGSFKLIAICPVSAGSEIDAAKIQLYLVNPRSEIVTTELSIPVSNEEHQAGTMDVSTISPLQAQLSKCISQFSAQENLGANVCTKARGIAKYGSMIALCVTLIPNQEVELSNPAEDNTVILFNKFVGTDEAVTWPGNLSVSIDPERTTASIIDALFDLDTLANTALNSISLRLLYGLIALSLVIDDGLRSSRCHIAGKMIPKLRSFSGCDMEIESKLLSAFENDERTSATKNISNIQQMMALTSKAIAGSQTTESFLLDVCPCCPSNAPLLWAADLSAQCERGHTFSRCCLTFLPILDPQWSKVCADCKREFINEHTHPELATRCGPDRILTGVNPSVEDRTKPTASLGSKVWCHLANFIFEKFDKCPYCNGFYFG